MASGTAQAPVHRCLAQAPTFTAAPVRSCHSGAATPEPSHGCPSTRGPLQQRTALRRRRVPRRGWLFFRKVPPTRTSSPRRNDVATRAAGRLPALLPHRLTAHKGQLSQRATSSARQERPTPLHLQALAGHEPRVAPGSSTRRQPPGTTKGSGAPLDELVALSRRLPHPPNSDARNPLPWRDPAPGSTPQPSPPVSANYLGPVRESQGTPHLRGAATKGGEGSFCASAPAPPVLGIPRLAACVLHLRRGTAQRLDGRHASARPCSRLPHLTPSHLAPPQLPPPPPSGRTERVLPQAQPERATASSVRDAKRQPPGPEYIPPLPPPTTVRQSARLAMNTEAHPGDKAPLSGPSDCPLEQGLTNQSAHRGWRTSPREKRPSCEREGRAVELSSDQDPISRCCPDSLNHPPGIHS